MQSPEDWQSRLDETFPIGVRVEYVEDGWLQDPMNLAWFCPRIIVEDVKQNWPYLRVANLYVSNMISWFQTNGEQENETGILFNLEDGGNLWLTGNVPPPVQDDVRDALDMPIYRDSATDLEQSA